MFDTPSEPRCKPPTKGLFMNCARAFRALLASLLLPATVPASAQSPGRYPYRDSTRAIPDRVSDLLSRMSPAEKFWQLFMVPGSLDDPAHDYSHGIFGLQVAPVGDSPTSGAALSHAERINAIQRYFVERTRLGIPIIPFDEGLHGLPRAGATAFPQAIGLAATWDSGLVHRVATAIARETRSRGIRQILSPVVNIASDVRWGRTEETYGEDPYLAGLMARAYVGAVERAGVVATPKHFVANVGDGGRDSYPIEVSERKLEETFFPPFRAALAAGARSIMTAYNSVDGLPSTQNPWLLTDRLKGAWGFTGFVISDAAATGGATVLHMTEESTESAAIHAWRAGLDVVFQSSWEQYSPYWNAFQRLPATDSTLNAAVSRVLRVKFALGLFDAPYADPDSAAYWNGHPEHRALALAAARESIVLLKNREGRLPLSRGLKSVAVIGPDAVEARLGGYSGPGNQVATIFEGVRSRLGAGRVRFAPGPGREAREYLVVPAGALSSLPGGEPGPGLLGEYFDQPNLAGSPVVVRVDSQVDFSWTFTPPAPAIPLDWYSVRWTGTLTVPRSGLIRLGVEGNDGYRLYLDSRLAIDNWTKRTGGARLADVHLAPGSRHAIRLEFFEASGNGRVRLIWDTGGSRRWRSLVDSAVALAGRSQAAIVVAGIEEGEFRDRADLGLPGHQVELIQRVARTGVPVIVVLVGGSAITMADWLDRVDGVIDAWYPGEAGGTAVTDVLFGDYNPGGRLPIAFPVAAGQLPLYYNHKPTGRGDDYVDLTGLPQFPFGFGLSYTSFEYSGLRIEPGTIAREGTALVRCLVRNIGRMAGDEVVQLYLRDMIASVARPVLELKGVARVHLEPGEEREVTFPLSKDDLGMLDRQRRWVVEPGSFRVAVGASSRDIRLRGLLTVQ